MGSFGHRIVLILFMFSIFGAGLFALRSGTISQFLPGRSSFSSQQIDVTEEALLERLSVSFPDIIMRLSKMNPQQQELFIEKVRRDVVSFACENGYGNEKAQEFGKTVAMVLSKAVSHPSIANAYF
ncbi:hypothetical protein [Bartonella rattimassiliensis]|nr:hypothetical protein [Bartonella rattimassiliensis]